MITDEQHAALHSAAQHICLATTASQYGMLPPVMQAPLARLALLCCCTHLSWWTADACRLDDPDEARRRRVPTPPNLSKRGETI